MPNVCVCVCVCVCVGGGVLNGIYRGSFVSDNLGHILYLLDVLLDIGFSSVNSQ